MADEIEPNADITIPTDAGTESITSDLARELINKYNTILTRVDFLTSEVEKLHQSQKTIMVGWNAFLKSAEAQLRSLFRGNIPAPIMKKLLQTAFKGIDDAERKGR